ncbi:hypothetical protein ACIBAG_31970 [Streptomyces sp. NPDC051243]|uniref:hypothetical protein n=1 Tax=Streptomyces sp. NPDC051243 TaxID=3365646 RepID=UPI00379E18AA
MRADFLRLLVLGITPSRAELILDSANSGAWRDDDLAFAKACDAVSAAAAPYGHTGQMRLTPARVTRFLRELNKPGTTIYGAAAVVRVTKMAIHKRRSRDAESAKATDAARAVARKGR